MPYVCEGWNQGRRMSESAAFIIFWGSLTGGAAGGAPCRVAKPEGERLTRRQQQKMSVPIAYRMEKSEASALKLLLELPERQRQA